jgi:hypothetical protein
MPQASHGQRQGAGHICQPTGLEKGTYLGGGEQDFHFDILAVSPYITIDGYPQ